MLSLNLPGRLVSTWNRYSNWILLLQLTKLEEGGDGGVLFGGASGDSSIGIIKAGRGDDGIELIFEGDGDVNFESNSRLEDNPDNFLTS